MWFGITSFGNVDQGFENSGYTLVGKSLQRVKTESHVDLNNMLK